MIYPAHFRISEHGSREIQATPEHCRNTAALTSKRLACVCLSRAGYLVGLTHDMGKMTVDFAKYMGAIMSGKSVRRGSVIHSFAAARFFLERFHSTDSFSSFRDMTAELLAYSTGAHHGLFDCMDQKHRSGFFRRMTWDTKLYREASREFQLQCADLNEIDTLFAEAHQELAPIYQWINSQSNEEEIFFYLGLLARLLLSAVIEGDRFDTAQYMRCEISSISPEPRKILWPRLLARMERQLDMPLQSVPILQSRQIFSYLAKEASEESGCVYRLSMPAGNTRTCCALYFALTRAARYENSRIIFTSPSLTLSEQNSRLLQTCVDDDALILEHYSDVLRDKPNGDELLSSELLCENWEADLIVTSLEQLLNTLFDGRTSCIRRFQALCGSILIIDEFQAVPLRMLSLFNLAINFLTHVCKATVVLCSAVQPCMQAAAHPLLSSPRELFPCGLKTWGPFRQTQLLDAGALRLKEIPNFIRSKMERTGSLLVICNLKTQAQFLYQQLKHDGYAVFHLSAGMCQAHRRDIQRLLKTALKAHSKGGPNVLCISTSVMESGTGFFFDSAIRLTAGMEHAVLTAGQCRRNAAYSGMSSVFLLNCSDENLGRLREIQNAKTASLQLLSAFRRNPERFNNDLASNLSLTYYYRNLYESMAKGAQDYPTEDGSFLFDLLSVNDRYTAGQPNTECFGLRQAFALAGRTFRVFDQKTVDVLVPYGHGKELIDRLSSLTMPQDFKQLKDLLQKAGSFSISVYQSQQEWLKKQGALTAYKDGAILVLDSGFYDSATGFVLNPDDFKFDKEV